MQPSISVTPVINTIDTEITLETQMGKPAKMASVYVQEILNTGAIHSQSELFLLTGGILQILALARNLETIFVHLGHSQNPLRPPIFEQTSPFRVLHPSFTAHSSSQVSFFSISLGLLFHPSRHPLL
jgi:hypothetical protein